MLAVGLPAPVLVNVKTANRFPADGEYVMEFPLDVFDFAPTNA
jgi:hypothetical protein